MPRRRDFPTGGEVAGEDLVGREPILRDLYERVYVQGNPVVLSAPRQTGKTSVIAELLRRVRTAGGWGIRIVRKLDRGRFVFTEPLFGEYVRRTRSRT